MFFLLLVQKKEPKKSTPATMYSRYLKNKKYHNEHDETQRTQRRLLSLSRYENTAPLEAIAPFTDHFICNSPSCIPGIKGICFCKSFQSQQYHSLFIAFGK